MTDNKKKIDVLILTLIFISFVSYGQSRQDKTITIINKMNFIEAQKIKLKTQIELLKYKATAKGSFKTIELEKLLSDEEIVERISNAFNEILSDKEVNDIYDFIQSTTYEKFFNSEVLFNTISAQFSDVNDEIENMTKKVKKSIEKFERISIDKKDGFYIAVAYNPLAENKNIKLKENPSLTSKDILKVKKVYSKCCDKPEIKIVFTKEGAKKLHTLTKENIGRYMAIVIAKHIVLIASVKYEIVKGKIRISGDFDEEEIDEMVKNLKQ